MSDPQVLIVGSGPSGLVLALSLIKNGINVRIIEKDKEHHNGERGPGVMPRTLEIEHFLGVEDQVVSAGARWPKRHFYDPSNPKKIIRSMEMLEKMDPTPAFPITYGVMLGQYRHQAILRAEIERLGGSVELGTSLVDFTQDDDGVTAEIVKIKGGKEEKETSRFKYLIGADGGRSIVRKTMGVDFVGTTEDSTRIFIVDATVKGLVEATEGTADFHEFKTGAGVVALRGTGLPNKFQILIIVSEEKLSEITEDESPERIQAEVARITGRQDLTISDITWKGVWRPNLRIASNFKKGNVFIIGDAAHTHSPTGGQGLNSSIQDSFNLGWKLALALKGHSSPILLDSYEAERIPVISEMLQITTDIFKKQILEVKQHEQAIDSQSSTQPQAADPHYRSRKLFQLNINYRWSPIVIDERYDKPEDHVAANAYGTDGQEEVRAGDRAPDAPGLIQVTPKNTNHPISRFFDLFTPNKHTVLLFTSSLNEEKLAALLSPLQTLGQDFFQIAVILSRSSTAGDPESSSYSVFRDSEGHAFTGYGIKEHEEEPVVVIVRPDSMIGAFVRSVSGVERYIANVFSST